MGKKFFIISSILNIVLIISICCILIISIQVQSKQIKIEPSTITLSTVEVLQPKVYSTPPVKSFVSNDSEYVLDVGQILFTVCQDVKTYNNPLLNELYLQGSLEKGDKVKIREFSSDRKWVLISVNPAPEYVEIIYLSRVDCTDK